MRRHGIRAATARFQLRTEDQPDQSPLTVSPRQRLIQVNGTGIDLDYYPYCPPPVGEPRFLLIARLIRDKGVVEYVDAARVLRAKYPEARFRLLGPVDNDAGDRASPIPPPCG